MELNVVKQEDISLNQLIEKKDEGLSVVRSAHVGNSRMYNLVLADAGVDMLLVDHNQTTRDRNYLPEITIVDGQAETLTESRYTISLRTKSDNSSDSDNKYLDEVHTASLSQAFPNAQIFTNTEYLRNEPVVVSEIINICAINMPHLFNRLVLPDGTTDKKANASDLINSVGILQLSDNPRDEQLAVMMPNELDIICGFVIEALKTKADVQYHISGPDMINYIKGIMPDLKKIYSLLSSTSFAKNLPDILKVELVPGTPLGLATTKNNFARLKPLTDSLEELESFEARSSAKRKALFEGNNPSPQERQELLDSIKVERDMIQGTVKDEADQASELLSPNDAKTYLTQYDSLRHGGLFVPKITTDLSVRRLGKIMKAIKVGSP